MEMSLQTRLALVLGLISSFVPWFWIVQSLGRAHGNFIRKRTEERSRLIVERAHREDAESEHGPSSFSSSSSSSYTPSSTSPRTPSSHSLNSSSSQSQAADNDSDWEKIGHGETKQKNQSPAKNEETWAGVVGFFHPFCNAGGGGERVLWTAIRCTQSKYPKALCIVYTGDHDVNKEQMLEKVQQRFSIKIHAPRIVFLYLSTRHYVLSSTWPRFTLLGQSLGSILLAYDAFNLLVPDIFIDTMGYAFALALCKFLFPSIPTGAYVHYPTISTDMLSSLSVKDETVNTGTGGIHAGAGKGWKGMIKLYYWQLFAQIYSRVGRTVDVVMTNSSWTQAHIRELWGSVSSSTTSSTSSSSTPEVVFPPVAVKDLASEIPLTPDSEMLRTPTIIYIAQFRPEKNHELVLRSFAKFLSFSSATLSTTGLGADDTTEAITTTTTPAAKQPVKLKLIGSVRDDQDRSHVYSLRLLARELHITDSVSFILEASWPECVAHLRSASVGVNAMWNEHFGIGVVEYQAAGLLSVVNNSGGPKGDIVVPIDGKRTGWWASSVDEYAEAFGQALGVVRKGRGNPFLEASSGAPGDGKGEAVKDDRNGEGDNITKTDVKGIRRDEETIVDWRRRARQSAQRFSEEAFEERWDAQFAKLLLLLQSSLCTSSFSSPSFSRLSLSAPLSLYILGMVPVLIVLAGHFIASWSEYLYTSLTSTLM